MTINTESLRPIHFTFINSRAADASRDALCLTFVVQFPTLQSHKNNSNTLSPRKFSTIETFNDQGSTLPIADLVPQLIPLEMEKEKRVAAR